MRHGLGQLFAKSQYSLTSTLSNMMKFFVRNIIFCYTISSFYASDSVVNVLMTRGGDNKMVFSESSRG